MVFALLLLLSKKYKFWIGQKTKNKEERKATKFSRDPSWSERTLPSHLVGSTEAGFNIPRSHSPSSIPQGE